MTFKERLKVHAEVEKQDRKHLKMWRHGVRRKHRAKDRYWGVVRGERGIAA